MEIKDLCTLIEENDDENRGVHFPLTDIYNEGWLLRLVMYKLSSNDELKRILRCNGNEQWFSEAELPSPFLQGNLNEKRTHADVVFGSFKPEIKVKGNYTKTGVEIVPKPFKQFYAIEAKMYSSLSKDIKNWKEYNQATRYVGCLAYMAYLSNITEFNKLGLYIFCPENTKRIKHDNDSLKKLIEKQLHDRIEEYKKKNPTINNKFFSWWDENQKGFLSNIIIEIHHWEEIVKVEDRELFDFYEKCKSYNRN